MREITLFLHSQKIQRPEPVISTAVLKLAAGLRAVIAGLRPAHRTTARSLQAARSTSNAPQPRHGRKTAGLHDAARPFHFRRKGFQQPKQDAWEYSTRSWYSACLPRFHILTGR